MKKNKTLKVAVIMGSQSDYKTMQLCTKILKKMGIKYETKIIKILLCVYPLKIHQLFYIY